MSSFITYTIASNSSLSISYFPHFALIYYYIAPKLNFPKYTYFLNSIPNTSNFINRYPTNITLNVTNCIILLDSLPKFFNYCNLTLVYYHIIQVLNIIHLIAVKNNLLYSLNYSHFILSFNYLNLIIIIVPHIFSIIFKLFFYALIITNSLSLIWIYST